MKCFRVEPILSRVLRSDYASISIYRRQWRVTISLIMEKRYQVFISSTYGDLQAERRAVIETVIELDCIPAGMELFPAADEEQLAFIKRVIDDCDYYLLIIGGRYGSVSESGISYTEQEYDYAVSRGLKIIALIHSNPEEIPLGKSELDPALREKLQKFKDKVSRGRIVKFWKSGEELPALVSLSLSKAIRMFPAVGWVRASAAANVEVLTEINELRKRNAELQKLLADVAPQPALEGLAGLDEPVKTFGLYHNSYFRRNQRWETDSTWRKLFGYLSPYLVKRPHEDTVRRILATALFAESTSRHDGSGPDLDDQLFQTIGVQLKALGLVTVEYSESTTGTWGLFWALTGQGERLMIELRVVRTKTTPDQGKIPSPEPAKVLARELLEKKSTPST